MLVGYRTRDMLAPQVDTTEAFRREIGHFLHCIQRKEETITGGSAGLHVVDSSSSHSINGSAWKASGIATRHAFGNSIDRGELRSE
jgi:hypothetical protein